MSRVTRYVAVGGVMDFAIYVALSLAPLLAAAKGAGALTLGALPVAWGLTYSATAVWGGRVSDRISRTTLARLGLLLTVLVCVAFAFATEIWHYFLGYPFIALGMALFWPGLQAAIADESAPGTLARNLGWFNVTWGLGKGLGVLAGGLLVGALGRSGFLLAAGVCAVLLVVMPRVPHGGGRGRPLVREDDEVPARTRNAFRISALLANFGAFGLGTTIVNHYPDLLRDLGRTGVHYGVVAGGVFLAQTGAFLALLLWRRWTYRALPHLLVQALCGAAALLLATDLPTVALLPFMVLVGLGFGLSYFSSIYYSLHTDAGRGGRAGLHEAIIGTGNFLVPLLAGVVAGLLGSSRVPYLFAAGVLLLSLIAQVVLLAKARIR